MKEKKTIIFNIDKRCSIAAGYIRGDASFVDTFIETLTKAMDLEDKVPSSIPLSGEDKAEFTRRMNEEDDDDVIVIHGGNKIHTLDEFL